MDSYDVVIDDVMIQNTIETNASESFDLLSIKLLLYVFCLGFLPSLFLLNIKITPVGFKASVLSKLKTLLLLILIIVVVLAGFGRFYASFFREHKPLRYYASPLYTVYSGYKFVNHQFENSQLPVEVIGEDAIIDLADEDRELVILVLGESARADHFSLNDYHRKTNPLLEKETNLINFPNFYASATSTSYALPCMFSEIVTKNCNNKNEKAQQNLLDVLGHTDRIHTLWRDNNSDSKGVALRTTYQDFKDPANNPTCEDGECRDIGMLSGLQEYINEQPNGDIFIVLHQMGSHGPAYYKRYPKEFEQFTPVCKTNQLNECSNEEIINAYDNIILYTDYFLAQVISLLKTNSEQFETAMVYMSDHGESLGEKGVYLHGMPYLIAPKAQKHIPAMIWFGGELSNEVNYPELRAKAQGEFSHDNLFHTMLGLMEVESSVYDKELDIIDYYE